MSEEPIRVLIVEARFYDDLADALVASGDDHRSPGVVPVSCALERGSCYAGYVPTCQTRDVGAKAA